MKKEKKLLQKIGDREKASHREEERVDKHCDYDTVIRVERIENGDVKKCMVQVSE